MRKTAMRQLANNPASIQALTDQILAQKVVSFLMERTEFILVDEEAFAEEAAKTLDEEESKEKEKASSEEQANGESKEEAPEEPSQNEEYEVAEAE